MKLLRINTRTAALALAALLVLTAPLLSQGYSGPLTIQGLDRNTLHSAAARAMGGITVGLRDDIGLMFDNPASLLSLNKLSVSLGAIRETNDRAQVQQYAPVRYYSNFSLLMESLTHLIPNPNPALGGSSQADTVQRPYDAIGPNWSRSDGRTLPLQGLIAMPFSWGGMKLVAGVGAVEYADLNHYYQNNNVLSPPILLQRPIPTFRPTNNAPVSVDWSQYLRSRDGALRGYGVALSGGVPDGNLSFGLSGLFISGSTDDFEQHTGRGRLTFYANSFRLDSAYRHITSTGSSEYSGTELTVSGIYRTSNVSVGITAKLPTTITRSYATQTVTDTTGVPVSTNVSGEDELTLPWRGTVALSLTPRENLRIGLEYEVRSYNSAIYKAADGTETSPWLSASVLHVGLEYIPAPWLALRAGLRGHSEVFEQDGNPIEGEPVISSVYSAGFGIVSSGLRVNFTYEYSPMKYEDIWGSAISKNSSTRNAVIIDVNYELPWEW